jgi:hypothetical protein
MAEKLGVDIRKYPQLGLNHPLASIRKEVTVRFGTLSGTTTEPIPLLPAALSDVKIEEIWVTTNTTLAADGTNYWAIDFEDRGAAGTGTTALFSSAQDTQTTGFTKNVPRKFVPDQNRRISQGSLFGVRWTKANAAANLDGLSFTVVYRANA